MTRNEFYTSIKNGGMVFGTMVASPSPKWAGEIKRAGADFVFIDTEHISIDREKLSWMCNLYRELNLNPVVRISSPDPYLACMALDGGACGIVAPYIETVEQVKALEASVKYRPLKGERVRKIVFDGAQPEEPIGNYLKEYNDNNLLIVNIESVPAIDNLDNILKVPGLDAVLIGPHDLSCSLGIPEDYNNKLFDEAVRIIISKARACGIGAGIHYFWGIEKEIEWAKAGLNFIIHSSDLMIFANNLARDIKTLRDNTVR